LTIIKFSDLDFTDQRAASWLADEVGTLTPNIIAAAAHVGDLLEAVAFMKAHPKGTTAHAVLASRLRLGDNCAESILDCIRRAAPAYRSMCEASDAELDELLADLKGMAVAW
jgi:hypothetical protein